MVLETSGLLIVSVKWPKITDFKYLDVNPVLFNISHINFSVSTSEKYDSSHVANIGRLITYRKLLIKVLPVDI